MSSLLSRLPKPKTNNEGYSKLTLNSVNVKGDDKDQYLALEFLVPFTNNELRHRYIHINLNTNVNIDVLESMGFELEKTTDADGFTEIIAPPKEKVLEFLTSKINTSYLGVLVHEKPYKQQRKQWSIVVDTLIPAKESFTVPVVSETPRLYTRTEWLVLSENKNKLSSSELNELSAAAKIKCRERTGAYPLQNGRSGQYQIPYEVWQETWEMLFKNR